MNLEDFGFKGKFVSGAILSDDRKYRYALFRIWDPSERMIVFIGLNPSTADETVDDPTIRRCINYAKAWGYGGLVMLNVFAYRATKPNELLHVEDPVGPENEVWIQVYSSWTKKIILCWGTHGALHWQGRKIYKQLDRTKCWCFGYTKGGEPKHPLYQRKDAVLIPFHLEAD